MKKLLVLTALLSIMYAIPTMAQISTKVTFDVPTAFYAGNAKMPAGSYTVTQPNTDVSFTKYGDVEFLGAIRIEGEASEMQILPSKVEQNAAKAANADKSSFSATSTGGTN